MIVPNQTNLKVHFAAAENNDHFCELKTAGVNYLLFTVYPLICEAFGIKVISYQKEIENTAKKIFDNSRHCIMDSGLFTLMFGSKAGKKDEYFIDKWYEHLIDYVKRKNYSGTCVEVDCQKVLGVSKAWEFRERMKNDIPNNRQINVFHKEDGQKGLDRLIEFSDYIAISVPELRFAKQKKYTHKLAYYIKNKKPSIDIHLLGCTEKKMLRDLNFCSSADSTSWNSCVRYGHIIMANGQRAHVSRLKKEYYEQYYDKLNEWRLKTNTSQNGKSRGGKLVFQIKQLLKVYEHYAGSQE